MYPNAVTGRGAIYAGYPLSENEYTIPDPGLTLAIIIFCIAGPFWLIYRLGEYVAKKIGLLPKQVAKAIE